jgi:hypothetical protein
MVVIFLVWYVAHSFFRVHHDRFIEEAVDGHLRALAHCVGPVASPSGARAPLKRSATQAKRGLTVGHLKEQEPYAVGHT